MVYPALTGTGLICISNLGPGTTGRIKLRKIDLQNDMDMVCIGLLRVKPRAVASDEKAPPEAGINACWKGWINTQPW